MNVAFFDRDGTIAEDYLDEQWANIDTPVLMPYIKQVLRFLQDSGYEIIIVSNQYLIGENYITQAQYDAYNDKLLSALGDAGISILDVFYCPHSRNEECDCMKPKTGLIKQALEKYPDIELSSAFVVGDSLCDMQMAEQMKLAAYGISLDYIYERFTRIDDLEELLAVLTKSL